LLLAAAFGALLGLEREWQQKAAGLRTNILIAMGAALSTTMSIELASGPAADPSRIASQIVTGVGFLGAGAIIRTGGQVRGLTTAATIWMNAAVGVAAGGGEFRLAAIGTVIAFVVLQLLVPIEKLIDRREKRLKGASPSE
jgi:putative Mg2+ transporter-C (MgtC) family protein